MPRDNRLSQILAVETTSMGAMIWWNFSPVPKDEVRAALDGKGLSDIPLPKISAEVALKRMMEHAKDLYHRPGVAARFMVRPLRGKRHEWALVKEIGTPGQRNDYEQWLHVRLVNDMPYMVYDVVPQMNDPGGYLTEKFQQAKNTLMADDLSSWLKGLLNDRLDGVLLRDAGGVWFVPKLKVPALNLLGDVFGGAKIAIIGAMYSENAAQQIIQGMEEEAKKALDEINAWYDANSEFNDRNLKTRKAHESTLVELKAKVERYEKIVGKSLYPLQSRLLDMKNKVAGTFFRNAAAIQGQSVEKGQRVLELDDNAPKELTPEERALEWVSDPEVKRFEMILDDVARPDAPKDESESDDEGRKVDIE